jgi:MFS family permease
MEKSMIASIVMLLMINITDSVTNSVVGPSLIFYVTEMGGSKEEYGTIMSSTFLSGILMTSLYGAWVDRNGNRYKGPYAASFVLGMAGSLVYFLAAICPPGKFAMRVMLAGRLVTGMGSSGRTLAYTWVATAIPRENQRNVLTLLSMTRTVGMIMGPALNALVAKVDAKLVIASKIIPITPNNSPGLLLFVGEGLLFAAMYVFLEDPPPKVKDLSSLSTENEPHSSASLKDIWNAVTSFDLALPMANLFFLMCNFTL